MVRVTNSQLIKKFDEVNRRINGQDETMKSIQASLSESTSAVKALVTTHGQLEFPFSDGDEFIQSVLSRPLIKLRNLHQSASVSEYNDQFNSLRNQVAVPPEMLLNLYVGGLISEIRNKTLLLDPKSISQAMNMAMVQEELGGSSSIQTADSSETRPEDTTTDHDYSSITRFDICPKKLKLKTPLLVKNREKRNQIKEPDINILGPGMVLLKGYICLDDQVKIVKTCRELGIGNGGFYQPGFSNGAKLHLKMMCLGKNWDPESNGYTDRRPIDNSKPPKIPDYFQHMVKKALKDSNLHIQENKGKSIPRMLPDICIVKFYTKDGKLGLHQHKSESKESLDKGLPVVSFSIGDTAEFLYEKECDIEEVETLHLESGDVLIFGGESRHIFHGVNCIIPDTAPRCLLEETYMCPGRLNLTFSQF